MSSQKKSDVVASAGLRCRENPGEGRIVVTPYR